MTFEFVIVYKQEETPIRDVLIERISQVLTDNLNEFDSRAVQEMVRFNYERKQSVVNGEPQENDGRVVLGFTLNLPEETASARTVIDEFCDALREAPIEHVLKFEDPLLRQELVQRAEELFALEMKLRRVLSAIYLHAYRDQPFNLLREESQKPMSPATEEQMKKVAENEFFFLTFGQYVGLNQKPDMEQLPKLLDLVRTNETYDALRVELERQPVSDEDDAVFLAGLRQRMDAIEAMRNCVAHNRRPSSRVTDNYLNVLSQVDASLNEFLARWANILKDEMDSGEMHWDAAARKAVELALKDADWDKVTKTITFHEPGKTQARRTVDSRKSLESYLCDVARIDFYANAPRVDGKFLYDCEDEDIVGAILADYEDRLKDFFTGDKE